MQGRPGPLLQWRDVLAVQLRGFLVTLQLQCNTISTPWTRSVRFRAPETRALVLTCQLMLQRAYDGKCAGRSEWLVESTLLHLAGVCDGQHAAGYSYEPEGRADVVAPGR